jgi:hypothetical protein
MGRIIGGIFGGIFNMVGSLIGGIFGGVFGWIGKIVLPVGLVLAVLWGITNPGMIQGLMSLLSGGAFQVTSVPAVINQIRTMNTLVTMAYEGEVTTEVKTPSIFGRSEHIVVRVEGTILAGIDLARIREQDVTINGGTVTVRIPPAYIVSKDLQAVQQVKDQGWMGGVSPELLPAAEQKGRDELLVAACNYGILADAEREAQVALGDLLGKLAGVQTLQLIQDEPRPGEATGCP